MPDTRLGEHPAQEVEENWQAGADEPEPLEVMIDRLRSKHAFGTDYTYRCVLIEYMHLK